MMPTVAQVLSQRPTTPGPRFVLATVTAVAGAKATVALESTAETTALVPPDIQPAPGNSVLVLVSSAANVILCRLELS
ncbi:hypothetical protein [Streptomyces sp. NPDC050485]|uniref:hypothetical protein n=1 Tax=Streptomyces sp. NPDC050485 TaxID=3365617 RepID=UPI0037A04A91